MYDENYVKNTTTGLSGCWIEKTNSSVYFYDFLSQFGHPVLRCICEKTEMLERLSRWGYRSVE